MEINKLHKEFGEKHRSLVMEEVYSAILKEQVRMKQENEG